MIKEYCKLPSFRILRVNKDEPGYIRFGDFPPGLDIDTGNNWMVYFCGSGNLTTE
jgi:hypothetical protein